MLTSCEQHDDAVVVWDEDEIDDCPLCDAEDEQSRLETKVEDLETEIDDLEDKVTDLEREVKEAAKNG